MRRVLPPRVKTARSFPLRLALVPFSGPPTSTPIGEEVVWFFAESVTRTASVCGPRVYKLRELVTLVGDLTGHRRPVIGLGDTLSYLQALVLSQVLADSDSEVELLVRLGEAPGTETIECGEMTIDFDRRRVMRGAEQCAVVGAHVYHHRQTQSKAS